MILYVIPVVLLLIVLVYFVQFNKIKTAQNQIQNAISSLDALFIKRHDLLPNLITVVKQYTTHERETLEKITQLRASSIPNSKNEFNQDAEANTLMKSLLIQVENYPELKANTQFTNLQYSWNEAEEQIAAGRRYVAASITDYNDSISTFPGNIIASSINAQKYEWQKATDAQRENVDAKKMFE